jgi:ribosomal protein L7/L12
MSSRRFLTILNAYVPTMELDQALLISTPAVEYATERVDQETADLQHEVGRLAAEVDILRQEKEALANRPARVPHDALVRIVLTDYDNMLSNALSGKKIQAIKSLRAFALCGLKEAKEAVEDSRVQNGF